MESITTKKTDYYLSDEEIDVLNEAASIMAHLVESRGDMINECIFEVEGTSRTFRGDDVDSCFWLLNDLTYVLENTNHITRTKSLKDFEDYHHINIDYTTI